MPHEHRRAQRWLRPPRNLWLVLAAITAGSAAALGWLGWEMLRQDARERRERDADRAVQLLTRELGDAGERLTAAATGTGVTVEGPVCCGVVVVFTPDAIHPAPSSSLIFHPAIPARAEVTPELFADAERVEYQQRHPERAAEVYRRLAQSGDPVVRVAALMRTGRALLVSGQPEAALEAYRDMAAAGDVPVIGLPADLVARAAELRVLDGLDRSNDVRTRAGVLWTDLTGGRWRLVRGQYEHYAGEVGRYIDAKTPLDRLAVARAVSDLWSEWQTRTTPSGRRVVRIEGVPLLVVWSATGDRLAAWIARPSILAERVTASSGIAITLSDADGAVVAGSLDRFADQIARTTAETRLPWTVHVGAGDSTMQAAGLTRGRMTVAGLAVMLLFLAAGSYFVARAVKQEMDLARLQSDFVSAVSHEFRTPLAAMRQLSELLAADRVPDESRRRSYYESLASESRRLQQLVENLLNVGRLEGGAKPYTPELLDAQTLVEEVVADFRSQLGQPECRIEVSGQGVLAPVMADRAAVSLALHNLLDNAVKYSGPGRTVWMEWARQGDRIAFSVRDEGPGLAPGEESRIFEKFVRGTAASDARVRGTGVGLAMVRLVASGHGGEVVVRSQPGAGATFTLLLPGTNRS